MPVAITRGVSRSFADCELTFAARTPIDYALACEQHRQYEQRLRELGCEVRRLPPSDDHPDCVFVEDTAVVLDDVAILTRPGAKSRRGEVDAVAEALRPLRRLEPVSAPATIDGGDVLVLDRRIFAGVSGRTNAHAVAELSEIATPYGYEVIPVAVRGVLHLKSAVTRVGERALLMNRAFVDARGFDGWDIIDVYPSEPHAANALWIGGSVVYPAEHPRTRERLERRGIAVVPVSATEVGKAEGGVTCCSLIVG